MGIANNAMEKIEEQSSEIAVNQASTLDQQENIENQQVQIKSLEEKIVALMTVVQHQQPQAFIAPPAPPVAQPIISNNQL